MLLVVFLAMAGPICGVKGAPGLRPGLVRVYAVVAVAKAGAYVAFAVLLHHIGVYILTLYQVKVCVCVCARGREERERRFLGHHRRAQLARNYDQLVSGSAIYS